MILKSKDNLLEKLVPILLVASIGLAFAVGMLWQKVQNLEGSGTTRIAGTQAGGTQAGNPQAAAQPQQPTKGVVTVDDDPVLGDKNAPITIVEFSDYECPFCKRHFNQTHQELVKKYPHWVMVKCVDEAGKLLGKEDIHQRILDILKKKKLV